MRQRRLRMPREVWILLGGNFLVAVGFGVVAPVLPVYARHFGVSISATTFLVTVFALTRLCFAPAAGVVVQRLGERWIYVSGLVVVAVSTTLCGFAQSYWQLVALRAVGGVGSTMFFIAAMSLIIRASPADARGRVAGLFATAFLLGTVGGPVLGSVTVGFGLAAPFLLFGSVLLVAAVVVFVCLRDSLMAAPAHSPGPTVSVRAALAFRGYRAALLSHFAIGWAVHGVRFTLVPLFITEIMHRNPSAAGMALAMMGIGNVCAVLPSGQLSDRIGRRGPLVIGLAATGVTTMLFGASVSLVLVMVVSFFGGLASGLCGAPQQAVMADLVGNEVRAGTAVATYQMMGDLGLIVGSLVVGEIAQRLSFEWGFALSGVVLLVAALGWLLAPETKAYNPIEGIDGVMWPGVTDAAGSDLHDR